MCMTTPATIFCPHQDCRHSPPPFDGWNVLGLRNHLLHAHRVGPIRAKRLAREAAGLPAVEPKPAEVEPTLFDAAYLPADPLPRITDAIDRQLPLDRVASAARIPGSRDAQRYAVREVA